MRTVVCCRRPPAIYVLGLILILLLAGVSFAQETPAQIVKHGRVEFPRNPVNRSQKPVIQPSVVEILDDTFRQRAAKLVTTGLSMRGTNEVCGDADNSGSVDIDDAVFLITYIFGGGPPPLPDACVGDADGSGGIDIDDVVYIVTYIFSSGPPPVDGCCGVPTMWESVGPFDGNAPKVIEQCPGNSDTVLVGTSGFSGLLEALYRSVDYGESWELLLEGVCRSLAIDPRDSRVVYTGILYDMYKSTDAGESWNLIEAENLYPYFWYSEFLSITLDPSDPDVVYACGADVFTGFFLFVSTDAGDTWEMLLDNTQNPGIHKIVVDPKSSDALYGATQYSGIYASSDGGESWQWMNDGLTNSTVFDLEYGIVGEGSEVQTVIYAATYGGGVFASDNSGDLWQARSDGLATLNTTELTVNGDDGNLLYVGTNQGVCSTEDGGLTWQPTETLPPYHFNEPGAYADSSILGLSANAANWDMVYTSHFDVVYGSTNAGQFWDFIGLPIKQVTYVEADPFNLSTVYCSSMFGSGEFHKSGNYGKDWLGWVPPSPRPSGVMVVKVHPDDSNSIYLGSYNGGSGFYRSYDSGETWSWMNDGLTEVKDRCIEDLAVDPYNGDIIYLAALNGIFKSTDGGEFWEHTGLSVDTIHATCVAVHPVQSNVLYAGTYRKGLYRSTDSGVSWAELDAGMRDVRYAVIAVDDNNPDHVYVGTFDDGILKSTDAGDSWAAINTGLGTAPMRSLLVYNPTVETTRIYAGGWGEGVYWTDNGGSQWQLIDTQGLDNLSVSALEYTIAEDGTFILLAGTYGGSVFRTAIE